MYTVALVMDIGAPVPLRVFVRSPSLGSTFGVTPPLRPPVGPFTSTSVSTKLPSERVGGAIVLLEGPPVLTTFTRRTPFLNKKGDRVVGIRSVGGVTISSWIRCPKSTENLTFY